MSCPFADGVDIGAQLRTVIANQGLSANELARRAGISRRIVERWLSGERVITLETAGRLATVLGVRLVEASRRRRGARRGCKERQGVEEPGFTEKEPARSDAHFDAIGRADGLDRRCSLADR
jgi:transcriptional regulator with XRE-family HTH domain